MVRRAEWSTGATGARGTILERDKKKFFAKAPAGDPHLAGQAVPPGWTHIYAVNEAARKRDAEDLKKNLGDAGLLYKG